MILNNICPYCGYHHEIASQITKDGLDIEAVPTKNSYSVCVNCSKISRFTESLHMRKVTEKDIKELYDQDKEEFTRLMLAAHILAVMPRQNRRN